MKSSDSSQIKHRLILGITIVIISVVGLLSLEAIFRPKAIGGLYFQQCSSETMMQTVSIEDLRKSPIQSLWYIHIQPPAFDAVRAILARIVGSEDATTTLLRVDKSLYLLWAGIYGMTIFVMFWWLSEMTSIAFATWMVLIFSAHPAIILYATLLDSTILSSYMILCLCYLMWRIKKGRCVSSVLLATSFLALYFTRSVFQWHWLLLMPVFLILLRYPYPKILTFLTITSLIVGLYTFKQITLFNLSSTSSFTGVNLCNSIGLVDAWQFYETSIAPAESQDKTYSTPQVLARVRKLNGALNYNNRHYLEINRRLQEEYRNQLLAASKLKIAAGYRYNLWYYFQPSSSYTSNIIVDHLPWRTPYDIMFSFPILPILLFAASLFWLRRVERSTLFPFSAMGLCLPIISIMLICILFERGENMRFKFFVEPVLFCYIATTFFVIGKELKTSHREHSCDKLLPSG